MTVHVGNGQERSVDGQAVERLLEMVEQRQPDRAMTFFRSLLDEGQDPDSLIVEVLAPVQMEVGRRWEDARWTVAQEHAATGVVQAALGVLSNAVSVPDPPLGQIVLACVEQEWHSLAARMLHERLRIRGWDPLFLGASTPADDLHSYLADADVVAAVVSCQIQMFLPGAARAVAAAHEAGVPVVVGGAAIGSVPARAVALGADAWCPDVETLERTLRSWLDSPPSDLAVPVDDRGEHLQVLAASPDVVRTVGSQAERVVRHEGSVPEIVEHLVAFLAAAVLVNDPSIFAEHVAWLGRMVTARGGRIDEVQELVRQVAAALPSSAPVAVSMARAVGGSMAGPGDR